jgi:hypothetical protein
MASNMCTGYGLKQSKKIIPLLATDYELRQSKSIITMLATGGYELKYDWGSKNVAFLEVTLHEITTINLWTYPPKPLKIC